MTSFPPRSVPFVQRPVRPLSLSPSARNARGARRTGLSLALAIGGAALLPMSAEAATDIQFWHAMTGALNERVVALTEKFNASQSDYRVVPVFKGSYPETMTAAVAAVRAGTPPHIVQVFEVGTATMANAGKAVKPVEDMMKEAGEPFDRKAYIPAVASYYTTKDGRMLSLPFNSSTTVFYYNSDAFTKAGVDKVPETWTELTAAAAKIKASGATPCAFTTGWQSWVQLESFSAWHNTSFATGNNGFDGPKTSLLIDSPLHVRHIENLSKMARDGLFSYGGRKNEPEAKFFSGECAMVMSSSAAAANIRKNAKFNWGTAKLPYYPDVSGAPQNTIIGGASLWVLNGHKAPEYKGVAKFFSFLSRPEIQAEWHQGTGYLPLTMAAYDMTKKSGFYEKNPGADVSVEQMVVKTTDKSRGIRLGNYAQIRDIIDEELEGVWSGKQDAKTALSKAKQRGNEQLERFARSVR